MTIYIDDNSNLLGKQQVRLLGKYVHYHLLLCPFRLGVVTSTTQAISPHNIFFGRISYTCWRRDRILKGMIRPGPISAGRNSPPNTHLRPSHLRQWDPQSRQPIKSLSFPWLEICTYVPTTTYWLPGWRGPTVSNGWVSQMSVTRPYHGR